MGRTLLGRRSADKARVKTTRVTQGVGGLKSEEEGSLSGFFPAALHAAPIMRPFGGADVEAHMGAGGLNVNEDRRVNSLRALARIPSLEKGGLGRVFSQQEPTLEIEPSPAPRPNPPRPSLFKGGRRGSILETDGGRSLSDVFVPEIWMVGDEPAHQRN